jgi:hypothetical protein
MAAAHYLTSGGEQRRQAYEDFVNRSLFGLGWDEVEWVAAVEEYLEASQQTHCVEPPHDPSLTESSHESP